MHISLDTTKWYDRIWAAFIFFTRLPFQRLYHPAKDAFNSVVEHWPLVGWLTGGSVAAILYFGNEVFSYEIVVITALLIRLLMTGAQHENGLAGFLDGFGGKGSSRQDILDTMKDPHKGTYGVIGLIIYYLLLFFALYSMSPKDAALTMLMADPFAKMVTAQLIQMMPYAHMKETAYSHPTYRKFSATAGISLAIQGLLPMALYIYIMYTRVNWQMLIFIPAIVMYFLYLLIWRRLRGYTADCCGAVCLITELATILVANYYLSV